MTCGCEMKLYPNTCKALKGAIKDEAKASNEYNWMAVMDGITTRQAKVLRDIGKQESEHLKKLENIYVEMRC